MSFRLESNVGQISVELRRRAAALVTATAFRIEANAKGSMSGPKSGRIYPRKGRKHQASAPGEAPAIDTGALVNSIEVIKNSELSATVGSNMEYAAILEFGGVRMAPRPWLGPAFESVRDQFQAGMRELLK
jgi:HK97 gp10 family phage protein